jgi:DNA repair photolyase
VRSAISRDDSPDLGFRVGLNPYRGCEHGCIYCFARPSHSFLSLTPGLDFETRLIAKRNLAAVYVTLTTLHAPPARRLEPRAAAAHRTIRTLAEAGIPVGVSLAPQIPFLNNDMEQVQEAARETGASRAFFLPGAATALGGGPVFRHWLDLPYPERAARVMARVQEMRGGRDYDSDFATVMKGSGIWADLLRQLHPGLQPPGLQPRAHAAGPGPVPAGCAARPDGSVLTRARFSDGSSSRCGTPTTPR